MKLKAIFDNIIIKVVEEEEATVGNIFVPDLGKESSLKGKVVSVGEGHISPFTGTFLPTTLKEGQIVLLPIMGPQKIKFEGEEYLTCPEKQVLSIIEE